MEDSTHEYSSISENGDVRRLRKGMLVAVLKMFALCFLPFSVIVIGIIAIGPFIRGEYRKGQTDPLRGRAHKAKCFIVVIIAVTAFPITIILCGINAVIKCFRKQYEIYTNIKSDLEKGLERYSTDDLRELRWKLVILFIKRDVARIMGGDFAKIAVEFDSIINSLRNINSTSLHIPDSTELLHTCMKDSETFKIEVDEIDIEIQDLLRGISTNLGTVWWDGFDLEENIGGSLIIDLGEIFRMALDNECVYEMVYNLGRLIVKAKMDSEHVKHYFGDHTGNVDDTIVSEGGHDRGINESSV